MKELIEVETSLEGDMDRVWQSWTDPRHIVNWHFPGDSWYLSKVEQDFRENGEFLFKMERKDKSIGFDFQGRYLKIEENSLIRYLLSDGRRVDVKFTRDNQKVKIVEDFQPKSELTKEIEKDQWQSILDNFKLYLADLKID